MINTTDTKHTISTNVSGNETNIKTIEFDSNVSGKSIYIQSGLHGGEITYWIQERLHKILKSSLVRGRVTLCPCANPIAWQQRSYFYTHGKFDLYDGKDFNRNFAGDSNGSLSEQISHKLYNIASSHDLSIDLHTSRNSIPFSIFSNDELNDAILTLGLKYNYKHTPSQPQAFDDVLNANGYKAFTIECGSHDSYEEEHITEVTNAICRILKSYDMIDANVKPSNNKPSIFTQQILMRASNGCYITFNKKAGDDFKIDDLLYTEHYPSDFSIKEIKAHEVGTIIKTVPTHIFASGDEVLHYVNKYE